MKKQLIHLIIAFSTLACCTGCFDINENLFLKNDGSGKFSFILEMEELKPMQYMFDGIEETDSNTENGSNKKKNKNKSNSTISTLFESTKQKLLQTNGISNVKTIEDTSNFTFGISFEFKNVSALNNAINTLFENDSVSQEIYFEYNNKQLKRMEAMDSKSLLSKSSVLTAGKNIGFGFDIDKLFSTVTYTTNYEFENKINTSQNQDAILSANMKKVTLKLFPFAAASDSTKTKASIANVISLH